MGNRPAALPERSRCSPNKSFVNCPGLILSDDGKSLSYILVQAAHGFREVGDSVNCGWVSIELLQPHAVGLVGLKGVGDLQYLIQHARRHLDAFDIFESEIIANFEERL